MKWLRVMHIGSSVGWLGAVAAFLVLAAAGLGAGEATVSGVYVAAETLTWVLIVPLCALTLVSGVAISLLSPWGLLNHYWVVFKLAITVAATIGLVIHLAPIHDAATAGLGGPAPAARVQLVVASALALVLLAVALWLSTFRPRGPTKRGSRRQRRAPAWHERPDGP
jgi:hypothetical protein